MGFVFGQKRFAAGPATFLTAVRPWPIRLPCSMYMSHVSPGMSGLRPDSDEGEAVEFSFSLESDGCSGWLEHAVASSNKAATWQTAMCFRFMMFDSSAGNDPFASSLPRKRLQGHPLS